MEQFEEEYEFDISEDMVAISMAELANLKNTDA